tara:strand:+ start:38 stop:1192 length:1155 start_codon:yes stop_codon:yes gene_type:complete
MANLSVPEITNKGKEYRSELLVNKVFKKKGLTNNFMTEQGLFHADTILINNKPIGKYQPKLFNKIVALNGTKIPLLLEGKFSGKNSKARVDIKKVQKSEEFGGQPSGGKRINKGIVFEEDLFKNLDDILQGKTPKGKYKKEAAKIIDMSGKAMGSPVKEVIAEGGKNQSRPIVLQGNNPIILPADPMAHGKKMTDITLRHVNNKFTYLSLKYGDTLTFMNSGVAKEHFLENDMRDGTVSRKSGKQILKAFGIDNAKFCKVFNDYGKGGKQVDPHQFEVKLDKSTLKKLLQTAIGANYWMVHLEKGGSMYFWEINKQRNDAYSNVSGNGTLYYGGKQGRGKRIDLEFSNQYFDFQMNIRNKQSGLYPSHIMLDYTSKPATGKKKL